MKHQSLAVQTGGDAVRGEFAGKETADFCEQRPLGADLVFEMMERWFVLK